MFIMIMMVEDNDVWFMKMFEDIVNYHDNNVEDAVNDDSIENNSYFTEDDVDYLEENYDLDDDNDDLQSFPEKVSHHVSSI